MLISLPVELILSVIEHVPSTEHKKLRFLCHHMNNILRPQLLSSVIFNVERSTLDLSLLETLAREEELDKPNTDSVAGSSVAGLVRKLTIYALDPTHPITIEGEPPIARRRRLRPNRLDKVACDKRLLQILGRSLYALRKITHLKCMVYTPQPSFVGWAIQYWFDGQLEGLITLELLSKHRLQIPRTLSKEPRCLSTLKSLSIASPGYGASYYTAGIPSEGDTDLYICLARCTGLERLKVISTIAHTFEFPSPLPLNHPQLALRTLTICNLSHLLLPPSAIAWLTPSLISLHIHYDPYYAAPSNSVDAANTALSNAWASIKPQDFCHVRSLHTNAVCRTLINCLSNPSNFEGLRVLTIDIRKCNSILYPNVIVPMGDLFFTDVIPALAERGLEELRIFHSYNSTMWSYGAHSSGQYQVALKYLKALKLLGISVALGDEDLVLSLIDGCVVHPCLRTLQVEVSVATRSRYSFNQTVAFMHYMYSLRTMAKSGNTSDFPIVLLGGSEVTLLRPCYEDGFVTYRER